MAYKLCDSEHYARVIKNFVLGKIIIKAICQPGRAKEGEISNSRNTSFAAMLEQDGELRRTSKDRVEKWFFVRFAVC